MSPCRKPVDYAVALPQVLHPSRDQSPVEKSRSTLEQDTLKNETVFMKRSLQAFSRLLRHSPSQRLRAETPRFDPRMVILVAWPGTFGPKLGVIEVTSGA